MEFLRLRECNLTVAIALTTLLSIPVAASLARGADSGTGTRPVAVAAQGESQMRKPNLLAASAFQMMEEVVDPGESPSKASSDVREKLSEGAVRDAREDTTEAAGADAAPTTLSADQAALVARLDAFAERLEKLDNGLEDLDESLGKTDAKASNKSLVTSGSSKSTMKVSGRIHLDAWGFDTDDDPAINQFNGGDDPENRLGFRRLRFGVAGTVKDNMVYKIEMEFAGGNDVEYRDAYLGWTDLPFLQEVLLGNQKRPYGLDHLNSSRYNVFMERPFVIEAFNEDARRLGLQSYGVSDDLAYNWRYGVFNQRNTQDEGNYVGDHLQLQIAGRLANTFWYDETSNGRGYGHLAISGSHADTSAGPNSEARFRTRPEARTASTRWYDTGLINGADYYDLLGLEGVLNLGSVQLVGEYQVNQVNRIGFEDVQFDGGYVYASYFLTGEHMPWDRTSGTLDRPIPFQNFWMVERMDGGRSTGWGAFQVAARYSQADFSDQDIFGGEGKAMTIALNWWWNANARMQFNYINGHETNSKVGDRAGPPLAGKYNIFGARFGIDF